MLHDCGVSLARNEQMRNQQKPHQPAHRSGLFSVCQCQLNTLGMCAVNRCLLLSDKRLLQILHTTGYRRMSLWKHCPSLHHTRNTFPCQTNYSILLFLSNRRGVEVLWCNYGDTLFVVLCEEIKEHRDGLCMSKYVLMKRPILQSQGL